MANNYAIIKIMKILQNCNRWLILQGFKNGDLQLSIKDQKIRLKFPNKAKKYFS